MSAVASSLRRPAVFLLLLPVCAALIASLGRGDTPLPATDNLRLYLIMPDRFDDGEPANNDANGTADHGNPLAVQGGDLKGIERRLDYLKALGVNAIWITPVQQNVPGAFHGYWIQHFKRVDPRLGDIEDLRRLVRKAHDRGMRVYLDVVCNHTGPLIGTAEGGHHWRDEGYTLVWKDSTRLPTPEALQDLSLYHNFGEVKEWRPPYQVLGELPGGLDDLRTEDPRVLAIMIDIWSWWLEQTGCDGFRVDTVKHVDMPFWYAWLAAMRRHAAQNGKEEFFIFGEVYSAEDSICAPYTWPDADGRRGFDAVFNFSIAEAIRDVFARERSVARIAASIDNQKLYAAGSWKRQMLFVDNHDMSRFLAVADGDERILREALVFLYGLPGVPLLYYGTEQGYRGGTGPDWENRESMFAHGWKGNAPEGDSFDQKHPLFLHIVGLNHARNATRILRDGSCTVEVADTLRQFIVLRRTLATRNAYVLLNASDSSLEWTAVERGAFRLWPADAGTLLPGGGVRLHARRSAWLLPVGKR